MARKIIFWICAVVLVLALGVAGYTFFNSQTTKDKDKSLKERVAVDTDSSDSTDGDGDEGTAPQIPVDFDKLHQENPDIYAWITIPDTDIDYPILQSKEEDDYYLNHTVDGTEGLPGSIMTEYSYNPDPLTDPVTVIYGHNMKDGSYFSHLHDYQDETFREEHSAIEIYTEDSIYTYKVFAAVTYDDRHILDTYDCKTTKGYQSFLDSLSTVRYMPSWTEDPLTVTTSNRIIILSTCNSNSDQRFIVGAVLTDVQ